MTKFTSYIAILGALAAVVVGSGCEKKGSGDEVVSIKGLGAGAAEDGSKGSDVVAPAPDVAAPQLTDQVLDPATEDQLLLYRKAKEAFMLNDLKTAEENFVKLSETGPLSSEKESGIIALAQIYRESGRNEQAIKVLNALTKDAPDLPEPYFLLGRAYAAEGKPEKAIEMYKHLLERQPDYLMALVELGAMYNAVGDKEQVVKTLQTYEGKLFAFSKKVESKETPLEEKLYALSLLALVLDERASLAFYRALRDPEPQVRYEAVTLIADDAPDEKTKKRILWMVENDPVPEIRLAAKETLKRINKLPALPPKPAQP